jgi:hypothetical protein
MMPRTRTIVTLLALLVSLAAAAVRLNTRAVPPQNQAAGPETPKGQGLLAGAVRLIETKQESEKAFQDDIVAHGLCAVILTLTNKSTDNTYGLQRSNIVIRTEFDAQLTALEPQRAYDRLMWKIGGGPAFAEYGIARAIGEGSRKKKLQKSVLAAAIGPSVTLAPGEEIEGAIFFDLPKDIKTVRFSTLVLGEIVNQKTGERLPLRFPLTAKP